MKWRGRRTSSNIEDRRGARVRPGGRRGMPGMVRVGGGRAGGLGALALVLLGLYFGVDLTPLLTGGAMLPAQDEMAAAPPPADDPAAQFVGVVLADTEEIWAGIFAEMGRRYQPPRLVLFSGQTSSACGSASAAVGPFYCPGDRKAYLDLGFFRVLERDLGAKGDFAAAYVIAHEIAHHVQNELGILPEIDRLRRAAGETEANRLSVRLELQADCLSGVWARRAQSRFGSLEPGDIEEALGAASRIGDDALQRRAGGVVVPDSFTHGTSAQRVRWFRAGFDNGDPAECDTFLAERL